MGSFFGYFTRNPAEFEGNASPPAYSPVVDESKMCGKPKPCDEKKLNSCDKACRCPCPPQCCKPCPKVCDKQCLCPQQWSQHCCSQKPCEAKGAPTAADGVGWDKEEGRSWVECSEESAYNACKLVLWTTLSMLLSLAGLMLTVSAGAWFQTAFIASNLVVSAIGIAGLYSRRHEYVRWVALWQYPATVAAFYFAWQLYALILPPSGLQIFLAALGVSKDVAVKLAAFATASPNVYAILVLVLFAVYGAGFIWSLFEWDEAASADCVTLDCECGCFKALADIFGAFIPASTGNAFDRLTAVFKDLFGGAPAQASKSPIPKSTLADSFKAASEKAI